MPTFTAKRFLTVFMAAASCAVVAASGTPGAPGTDDRWKHQDFIGVFSPVPTALPTPNPERCPDATHPILVVFGGTAHTNFGFATFAQSHCAATDNSSFRRGRQEITFANGQKLYGVYSGELLLTPTTNTDHKAIVDGTYRNTGGTGAFAGARGRGISAGYVDVTTGQASVTVSGSL